MANRHTIQKARGGKAFYEGGKSKVAKEAAEKNVGGPVVMKMSGGGVKARLDKRARGGRTNATSSPFSSAHSSKFDC